MPMCCVCGQMHSTAKAVEREPCRPCRARLSKGEVAFIQVEDDSPGGRRRDPVRTGRVSFVPESLLDQLTGLAGEDLLRVVRDRRWVFVTMSTWLRLGLPLAQPIKVKLVLGDFDYRRAWEVVAAPAYMHLSDNLIRLINRVKAEASDLGQLEDLSMPWPKTYPLKELFEQFSSVELAEASRVFYDYGHWAFDKRGMWSQKSGLYWKFSHYADQVLQERIGAVCLEGNKVRVRQGLLCIEYNTPTCYSGREVTRATPEDLARCIEWSYGEHWGEQMEDYESFRQWSIRMSDALWPREGLLRDFFDIGNRMREEKWVREEGETCRAS